MNRRKFLRRSSALGALSLAGCIADDENSGSTPTPDDSSESDPEVVGSSIERTGKGCASAEHGQASTSINDSEMTVTFTGRIITGNPCYEPTLERIEYDAETDTLTIAVGAEQKDKVCVDCVGRVDFSGTVEFEGGLPGEVTVVHDGETLAPASSGSATESDESPTLEASSFSVTNVSQSSPEESADASFDAAEETVVVTGAIVGKNGCMTADVGDVDYDAAADQLSVDVVTKKREDAGACTQQLIAIDYRATFAFDGGIPSKASVSHNGQGIVSAGYDSSTAKSPDSDDGNAGSNA